LFGFGKKGDIQPDASDALPLIPILCAVTLQLLKSVAILQISVRDLELFCKEM
jgi:hypothetical protein